MKAFWKHAFILALCIFLMAGLVTTKAEAEPTISLGWPCASAYRVTTLYFYNEKTPHRHSNFDSLPYYHSLDIAGGGNIVAAESGTVIYAGTVGSAICVKIRHADGSYTAYYHLASIENDIKARYNQGEQVTVTKGQVIGVMGQTGNADGVHLHFEWSGGDPWATFFKNIGGITYDSSVYKANVREGNGCCISGGSEKSRAYVHWKDNPHTCDFKGFGYDSNHPHSDYLYCTICNARQYTGGSQKDLNCWECYDPCSASYAGDYICTASSLRIRSQHNTSCEIVGTIPKDAVVKVIKANGSWAHIEYNGAQGLASMEHLQKAAPAKVAVQSVQLQGYNQTFPANKTVSLEYTNMTASLSAIITPSNATDKSIVWSSSNPSVATVTDGLVRAVGVGQTTIKAASPDGPSAQCTLTVAKEDPSGKLTLSADTSLKSYLPIQTYALGTGNIAVYKDDGSTDSGHSISGSSDLCTITAIYQDGWCRVTYPTSGGNREALARTADFFTKTSGEKKTAQKGQTAYRRSSGSATVGSVSAQDACLVLNSADGRVQVIYPVTGGYKMGWVSPDVFTAQTPPSNPVTTGGQVVPTANGITIAGINIGYGNGSYFTKNGQSCQNSYWSNGRCHKNGVCETATHERCNCMRYWPTGNPSTCRIDLMASQCFGFARYCQWALYGSHDGNNPGAFTDISGSISAANCTGSALKSKLLGCAAATHVRTGNNGHSIVIIGTSDSGVVFADCNSDGYCKVRQVSYSWDQLASYLAGKGGVMYAKACKNGVTGVTGGNGGSENYTAAPAVPQVEPGGNDKPFNSNFVITDVQKNSFTFKVDISDKSGIGGIIVQVYNIATGQMVVDNPAPSAVQGDTHIWYFTGLAPGRYEVDLWTWDTYGNESEKGRMEVVTAGAPPKLYNVRLENCNSSGYDIKFDVFSEIGFWGFNSNTWILENSSNIDYGNDSTSTWTQNGNIYTCTRKIRFSKFGSPKDCYYRTELVLSDRLGQEGNRVVVDVPCGKGITFANTSITEVSPVGFVVKCQTNEIPLATVADQKTGKVTAVPGNYIHDITFYAATVDNGNDDQEYFEAFNKGTDGQYSWRVKTANHNNDSGQYAIRLYAYDWFGNCLEAWSTSNGKALYVNVPEYTPPTIVGEPEVQDIKADGYVINYKISSSVEITKVEYYNWTVETGVDSVDQDDLNVIATDGDTILYAIRVNTASHGGKLGNYVTEIYATDETGRRTCLGRVNVNVAEPDEAGPVISNLEVVDLTSQFFTVSCTLTDPSGVEKAELYVWSVENGQDDFRTVEMYTDDGVHYFGTDYVSYHGNERGAYEVVLCTVDALGNETRYSVDGIVIPDVEIEHHEYTAVVTHPTCTEDGFTTHTCSHCGDTYTDSTVPALGHSYGSDNLCIRCGEKDPDAVARITRQEWDLEPSDGVHFRLKIWSENCNIVDCYILDLDNNKAYFKQVAPGYGILEFNRTGLGYRFRVTLVPGGVFTSEQYVRYGDEEDTVVFPAPVQTLTLPKNTTTIEAYAFEGTAAEIIEIPAGVTTIGECAFANSPNLKVLDFAGSPTSIAYNILLGTDDVVIRCVKNSNIDLWARSMGYTREYK